ncbi:hypothetical protein BHE90_010017 [Fusarium euwallaceae]|uniref:Uncharacterized protein n=3 Tax=Fusarium solani species complex TaxID=232080 RepID=A0A3M2RHQ3_9HYPO|nr:hypothetical protein CDV36_014545 [Fusarium kuroshium]RSL95003.1 hypothetical protein CEP52_012301 [Fusarium oligoseptatum]RTE75532.1 hypothetical protein BHE90_010017 [Fusarium euwallaceae]
MIPEAAMRRMSLQETPENDQPEEHQNAMDTEAADLFEDMDTDEPRPDTAENDADAEGYEPDDGGEDMDDSEDFNDDEDLEDPEDADEPYN